MFLLALLHAALEVDVEWGIASVIRDVSEMMTAAVTLLKYRASQVQMWVDGLIYTLLPCVFVSTVTSGRAWEQALSYYQTKEGR